MAQHLTEDDHDRRLRLYQEGLKDTEIADLEGVTAVSILKWRRRNGLEPNAPSGGQSREVEERFWEKVDKNGPVQDHMEDPCWVWTAGRSGYGYGSFWDSDLGRSRKANRVVFELRHGEIPDGKWVLHKCDHPPCVRPDHLYLGDAQQNVDDRQKRSDWHTAKGEDHYRAVISEDQARQIKRQLETTEKPQTAIAEEFEVSKSLVNKIALGQTWSHVDVGGDE